jgi:hypothetical protein
VWSVSGSLMTAECGILYFLLTFLTSSTRHLSTVSACFVEALTSRDVSADRTGAGAASVEC